MGADAVKCVCAPDSREVSYHSNMQKSGEKDRVSSDSDASYYDGSSSEGDVTSSSTESESNSESEEEESSSSSHRRRRKHRTKKAKHSNKHHKKHSKHHNHKKKKHKPKKKRKHHHKTKGHHHHHRQSDDSTSSESESSSSESSRMSYASSSDTEYSHDSNEDTQTMYIKDDAPFETPAIPHKTPSIRGNPRNYMLHKKRQKQQDRVKRQFQYMEEHAERQKMMEHQRQSYSAYSYQLNINQQINNNNNMQPHEEPLMPLQLSSRHTMPSLSHGNLRYVANEALHDSGSDHAGSSERGSVHSIHSAELPSNTMDGKHPRIHSMSHIDQATIELLTNPRNVQKIFNPKPTRPGVRVNVYAANAQNNASRSQPQSPQTVHVHSNRVPLQPSGFQPSMTPTTHHYYTYNNVNHVHNNPQQRYAQGQHQYSHSLEMEHFPSIQSFTSGDMPPGRPGPPRRNSNPPISRVNHNILFGQQPGLPDGVPSAVRSNSLPMTGDHVFDMAQAAKGLALNAVFDGDSDDNEADVHGIPTLNDDTTVTPTPGDDRELITPRPSSPGFAGKTFKSPYKPSEGSPSNISPKMVSEGLVVNNISPNLKASDDNAIPSEITISNLNQMIASKQLKIHGKNPHAVPPSPPIDSVYKPLPGVKLNTELSSLSKISESTHNSNRSSGRNDSSDNALAVKRMSSIKLDGVHANPGTTVILSSPDDDEDTVARQWMDLHKFNIPEVKVPTTTMDKALLSIQTEQTEPPSSDLSSAEEEVMSWRRKVETNTNERKEEEEQRKDSTYSTDDAHTSDELTSDDPHMIDMKDGTIPKRHSQLFRKQSFKKWEPTEVTDEANDMRKAYDHMKEVEQGRELHAMKQMMNDLQEKEKSSTHAQSNWIG